ncbi:tetratricopeptide repeat protein [[Eubacterium] cellulosolvens]
MKKNFKFSIPVQKQILLYLADFVKYKEAFEVDNAITQQGIAEVIGIRIEHVSRALKTLIDDGYLSVRSAHIQGINRKKKAFFSTEKGLKQAYDIKNWLNNKSILIRDLNGELIESSFKVLEKALDYKLKPLELFKYVSTSNEGIIALPQVVAAIREVDPKYSFNSNLKELVSQPKTQFVYSDDVPIIRDFFGREKELDIINKWIDDKNLIRFIVIHGIAGIGKTTLAAKLIGDYKEKKHIFWHNFQTWDSVRSVLSHIVEFLTEIDEEQFGFMIDFKKPLELEDIFEILKKKMKNLNALLVFDDFQKINDELKNFFSMAIEKFEKTDNVKFIVLSRYDISFYDRQKVLVKKSVAELGIEGLDFVSSTAILSMKQLPETRFKEIYKITSGNPLLLEIFESTGKTNRYIYEEIFSKFSDDERKVMEIMATYNDPISYDAFFVDNTVLPKSIETLIQKLYIKRTPDERYGSHEFIKEFFYKRLTPQTKRQYHRLCADFFIKNNQPIDIINAYFHLVKSEQYQLAIELVIKNSQKIIDQGFSTRFVAVLEELPEEQVALTEWVDILMLKARLYFIIGEWDKAIEFFNQSIEICSEINRDDSKAMALITLGHILEEQNLIDEALERFQQSLEIGKKIKNDRILSEAKRGIGRYHWRKREYKNAEKYYKDSLKTLKRINDQKIIGATYIDLGNIYLESGNYNQAKEYLNMALKYLEKVDAKIEIARAYNSLGTISTFLNDYNEAYDLYKKQLGTVKAIGDIRQNGYGLSNIGYCCAKLENTSEAEEYIQRANQIYEKTKNENILFQIYRTKGIINQHYHNWDQAIEYMQKSMEIIEKLNAPFYQSKLLMDFGLLYEAKGDMANANKCYRHAKALCQALGLTIPGLMQKGTKRK